MGARAGCRATGLKSIVSLWHLVSALAGPHITSHWPGTPYDGAAATANTGGGGGGGDVTSGTGGAPGGSGLVLIAYPT